MRLTMGEVCDFGKCAITGRNYVEDENLLNSGHLLLCGRISEEYEGYKIIAYCIQTSNIRGSHYEIKGIINPEGKIIEMICSCKAGLSEKCKHVTSVLLYCNRNSLEELNTVSCTDKKCVWSEPQKKSLQQYQPAPLSNHQCYRDMFADASTRHLQEEQEQLIKTNLYKFCMGSALVKHAVGRHDPIDTTGNVSEDSIDARTLSAIFGREESAIIQLLSNTVYRPLRECCDSAFLKLKGNVERICQETTSSFSMWKNERQSRITGSRCYEIFTYCQNKKPNWSQKSINYFYPKSFTNKYVKHGIVSEPIARKVYEESITNSVVKCGLIVSKSNPWLAYSPDGLILNTNNVEKLLEIKCPYLGTTLSINELLEKLHWLNIEGSEITIKKKHAYYAQVQLGMAILNVNFTDFMIFASSDNRFKIIEIEIDHEYTVKMLLDIKTSYLNNMLHNNCELIQDTDDEWEDVGQDETM